MNRGQLKTRTARVLGIALGTSDDAIAEDALLSELANEAVLDVLLRTRVHVRQAAMTVAEGETEFEIDDVILRFHRMRRGETGPWLEEQPIDHLDANGYAIIGYNRIVLGLPGGGSEDLIFAYYTPTPNLMTLDADDPAEVGFGNIPPQFHRALLNYMCWHAADKAGDQQAGRGERYRVIYEGQDGLALLGSDLGRIKTAVNRRATSARVRRHREVLASDVDPQYWIGG